MNLSAFSATQVDIMRTVEKSVRVFERNKITEVELIDKMLHCLTWAPYSQIAIEQSAARLPSSVHSTLADRLNGIRNEDTPGRLFVFKPYEPTEAEYHELNRQVRYMAAVLERFLDSPVARIELDSQ